MRLSDLRNAIKEFLASDLLDPVIQLKINGTFYPVTYLVIGDTANDGGFTLGYLGEEPREQHRAD